MPLAVRFASNAKAGGGVLPRTAVHAPTVAYHFGGLSASQFSNEVPPPTLQSPALAPSSTIRPSHSSPPLKYSSIEELHAAVIKQQSSEPNFFPLSIGESFDNLHVQYLNIGLQGTLQALNARYNNLVALKDSIPQSSK
ncbi:hypothetical protein H1R20_g13688, partial [Candolleomyces eurysporus]